jgi:hypothetical protein
MGLGQARLCLPASSAALTMLKVKRYPMHQVVKVCGGDTVLHNMLLGAVAAPASPGVQRFAPGPSVVGEWEQLPGGRARVLHPTEGAWFLPCPWDGLVSGWVGNWCVEQNRCPH